MKPIRSMAILMGVGLALLASGASRARAQALTTTAFSGTFTLPFEVQWANMTLPAGEYTLNYGHQNSASAYLVEVAGKDKGSPHGVILARGRSTASASGDALVCIRDGNKRKDMCGPLNSQRSAKPQSLRCRTAWKWKAVDPNGSEQRRKCALCRSTHQR